MNDEDDVKIEAEDVDADLKAESKVAKLREELSSCRADKQEYMDGWQRSKADYVNLLKRNETETKAAQLKGMLKAVEALLPGFDSLERAKEHLPAGRQAEKDIEGFLAVAKQLESAFAALGLVPIGVVGEPFDPSVHEALGQETTMNEKEDETVRVVLEKGYRIGDTIIRPAKVKVAHFTKTN